MLKVPYRPANVTASASLSVNKIDRTEAEAETEVETGFEAACLDAAA